jgi:protease II
LDGKYLKKRNTFEDFIACAEYLIDEVGDRFLCSVSLVLLTWF